MNDKWMVIVEILNSLSDCYEEREVQNSRFGEYP